MREILFKAKSIDKNNKGEWVQGYYRHFVSGEKYDRHFIDSHGTNHSTEIKVSTLCQYTGLKDQHGTKIFEGDVLRLEWVGDSKSDMWTACVEFGNPNREYHWGFQLKKISECSMNQDILLWVETELEHIECEVIGNIHDKEV